MNRHLILTHSSHLHFTVGANSKNLTENVCKGGEVYHPSATVGYKVITKLVQKKKQICASRNREKKHESCQSCRNPGLLESGIIGGCDICRQFRSYDQNFLQKYNLAEILLQHSGVSACLNPGRIIGLFNCDRFHFRFSLF